MIFALIGWEIFLTYDKKQNSHLSTCVTISYNLYQVILINVDLCCVSEHLEAREKASFFIVWVNWPFKYLFFLSLNVISCGPVL